jgi:2-polyprenyl-3-methyl-5-hydroxy-6-metoxy-1,4-benzoquinol methylase
MLQLDIERSAAATINPPLHDRDTRYFTEQIADNRRWAARMGVQLEAVLGPGVTVLDFGCGHGALSVEAARLGARVTGIDTSAVRVAFAARNAAQDYPGLATRLDFQCRAVQDLPGTACFDAILSKDTFEHIGDMDGVLAAFRRLLKKDGRVYLGFSPLWHSPFGDHGFLTRRRIPWLHLILGQTRFLAAHNAHTGRTDRSIAQAGFNQLKPHHFRAAFMKHGFEVEHIRINPGQGMKILLSAPLAIARRVSPLEAFATIGMYTILRGSR